MVNETTSADDWNAHWSDFGNSAEGNPANIYRERLIRECIESPPDGALIVDIGCGQGELARMLRDQYPTCRVLGIENSAEGVRRAVQSSAEHPTRLEFLQGDLLDLEGGIPEIDELASLAVCSEVLEHVDEPAVLLRNAALRLLTPGARLVVTVPGGIRTAFDRHIGHRRHFTAASLVETLEQGGYSVEAVYRAGFPFFNAYKLTVWMRGKKLIADLQNPDLSGGTTKFGELVLGMFDRTFKWNRDDHPLGWQLIAVARAEVERP